MLQSLEQSFDSAHPILALLIWFAIFVIVGLAPLSAAVYFIYFLLTLPMRRNERARLFLDALELGLNQGHTPEVSVTSVASSGDRSFGSRFFRLAERIRGGEPLSRALTGVPRLVPPQVAAMLQVGERIGDVKKVLPACRQVLRDAISQVRGALNYVIVVLFVATPPLVLVPIIFNVKVLPKLNQVLADLSGTEMPGISRFVFSNQPLFTWIQVAIILLLWIALLVYVGGPWFTRLLNGLAPGLPDRVALCLPWRRKRALRDFSSILALLLDSGVPENEAVALAGQATGNSVMNHRAAKVSEALKNGVGLPDALRVIDDQGELQWRASNAAHGGGFTRALAGWHESLDAKAFQLEQSGAQILTAVLVLINGAVVGGFVISVFAALIQIVNGAPLW
jgi:type IV pilus assembly protein PilC